MYDCARIPPDPVVLKQVLPGRFGGAAATIRMWTAQTQRSRCTEDSTTLPASNLAALKLSLMERKLESFGNTFWEMRFTDFLFFFGIYKYIYRYILNFLINFFFFYFTILYWFCHTSTCIRHGCTRVPDFHTSL